MSYTNILSTYDLRLATDDLQTGELGMLAIQNVTFDAGAAVKNIVQHKMDAAAYASWIAPLKCFSDKNILEFIAPNQFSVDFINRTYLHLLKDAAAEIGLTVVLSAGHSAPACDIAGNDNGARREIAPTPVATIAAGVVMLSDFIASDENEFVLSAAKKICAGAAAFSPLFVYGGDGCGKSMLARAIANGATGRVIHMTGAGFVTEFLRAMNERNVFAFKDMVRKCDTFVLDDVHALSGKRATTDEFLSLMMDLIRDGKNIVLTANAAPNALVGFDRRMQSVFASGLSVDLIAPNKSVRHAMLTRAGVPSDVADAVALRIPANGHIVSGIVKKIRAFTELMGGTVTTDVAERLLADTITCARSPIAIARAVANKLGVSYDDISGASRVRGIVRARQITIAILKQTTGLSLAEIGNLVGGLSHATVLYALARIDEMKKTDLLLGSEIADMVREWK